MTIKRRVITLVTDGAGAATGTVGLGAAFAKVIAVGWDSADDASSDLAITSSIPATSTQAALTHAIYTRTSVDASAAGGIVNYVVPNEAETFDASGEASAANTGEGTCVVAASPATVTIANGGASKSHVVSLFVEV